MYREISNTSYIRTHVYSTSEYLHTYVYYMVGINSRIAIFGENDFIPGDCHVHVYKCEKINRKFGQLNLTVFGL